MRIDSKLPNTGTTIFTVMSKMARDHNAINLSQGFPGFPVDPELIHLVYKHMQLGNNQYAPMPGLPRLKEKLAGKTESLYGAKYDPDHEITITAGATQALYSAITCLINKGDEVIVLEPAYDSYVPAIIINGGIPKYSKLFAPNFKIDWKDVESQITSKTKSIIINTPHNPTGAIINSADLDELERIVEKNNLFVLSDEVYEHLVFDNHVHESISKRPTLADRSFICYSFGKLFHATGWKTGYCMAPKWMMKEFRKIHQFQSFSCNMPMQHAFADYLADPQHYLYLNTFFEKKRDILLDALAGSQFKILPSKGTYFQLLDYSGISDEKDMDFATKLTKNYGIATIPISVFYHDQFDQKMIRVCFAKEEKMLRAGATKLKNYSNNINS